MARNPIIGDLAADLAMALRFYSRLPLPAREAGDHDAPALDRIAYAIPLAGLVIGLIGGGVLLLARALQFPTLLSAALAVAVMVLITGAVHEDGLADTADGLGGGRDRTQRLAIMRDSRVGTFGAVALVLSLLLRVAALDALLTTTNPLRTAFALAAAAAASRAAGILLLRALPPARADGASAAFGQPSPAATMACALTAALIVACLVVPSFGVGAMFAGLLAPLLALAIIARLGVRLIGGQTGDLAGATQQLAEIVFLLALLIFSRG